LVKNKSKKQTWTFRVYIAICFERDEEQQVYVVGGSALRARFDLGLGPPYFRADLAAASTGISEHKRGKRTAQVDQKLRRCSFETSSFRGFFVSLCQSSFP